jgi:ABC-type amino acid transport substrate-binding protein
MGALALAALTPAGAQSLKVGYFDVPPHVTQDKSGAATGAAVDLFKAVAQRMGIKDVTYQQLPLPRALGMLEGGELDAILFLSKNAEREAKFFYPAKPYFLSQPSLAIATKSSIKEIKTADDLKALKIGLFLGMNLSPSMRQSGLNLDSLTGTDNLYSRNFQKLTQGRVDAVYSPDNLTLAKEIKAAGLEGSVHVVPLPDQPNATYTVFNKKDAGTLGAKYAEALDAVLKERGDYVKAFVK